MNELKRLNFLKSENRSYILEMYENYFQNSESQGKIQQFIESYVQIEDVRFLQLTAVEEFNQAFELDQKKTICFLSSLARYLKNDLRFNIESVHSGRFVNNQTILRNSIYQAFSMFSCQSRDDLELKLMIKYELLVWNKGEKNYSRSLELVEEMLSICADSKSKGRTLFKPGSDIIHPLASFNNPEMYIQLQFNLIHSKLGNNLSEMRFDPIHESICFSRKQSDGKRISGKEYQEKFEKSSQIMYDAASKLLDDCKIKWEKGSETQVFEQFFFLILDVLIRRYRRVENNFGSKSLINDKKLFSKVERLIERSHLSDNVQSTSSNLEDSLTSSAVRSWLSEQYTTLFDSVNSVENNSRSRYNQISILRDSIGDIDENAPLAGKRKSRGKHIPAIQYFHRNDSYNDSDGNLILKEKIRHDLSNGNQGKLNRSNIYLDSVLLNMMKVVKIQNVPSGWNLEKLVEMKPFEMMKRLLQKSTGQVVEISSINMIKRNKVPMTYHSTDTKRRLDEVPELETKLSDLDLTLNLSSYFSSGYNVLQFEQKTNPRRPWKVTRSTKLDRLNVIAKGLSELREIIYGTIPGITKSNASRGYRENLLATESHPLLIISKKDAENLTEFDKTVYAIPFITHRVSEVVNLLAELNQYKQNLPIPFPYKKRYPILINKYASIILLEIKRLLLFIEELNYQCGFDVENDWVETYKTNLDNLMFDRKAALYDKYEPSESVRKFKGKNSAYKPLEVEREFVANLMNNDYNSKKSSVTGYLHSMTSILNTIICDENEQKLSQKDCTSLFEQLVWDVFGINGKYSPNELIVGAIAGVNLARGWSQ